MNWGTGITIAIVAFMTFILSMVVQTFSRDADLVQEDYYESEVNYDKNKEAEENFNASNKNVIFQTTPEGVLLMSPGTNIREGEVHFYRPDAKKWDKKYEVNLDENFSQLFPISDFHEGFYEVRLSWIEREKDFLVIDEINI